ncbi:MAG: sodium:glutamate symporter [Spirochaetales bacterium]|nr:sodium:glutamate symporter [Spirochaetales bacterium]MCF7939726.1 sodium:glutamate symporter [Spirochaetales bacterium]
MNFYWALFVDLGIVSLALILGTALRARIRFFQRFLVPNSITAGILLLLFYNFLAPRFGMDTSFLENLVFHLLNISFVAMGLRQVGKSTAPKKKHGRTVYATAMTILSQYAVQGSIGLLLTLIFIKTIIPDLFPSFGFFVPLGFALGPGQAYAIGQKWEAPGLDFAGAGTLGLTFAAVGFFWAIFGGMLLINIGIRKGWVERPKNHDSSGTENRSGIYREDDSFPVGSRLTTHSDAIESMSFTFAVILAVYLVSYLFLKGLGIGLQQLGPLAESFGESLWGVSFIFSAVFGMLARKILGSFRVGHLLETGQLTRTAGFSVDFMVAASIGAISLQIVAAYWVPILTMGILAGLVTILFLPWLASRVFTDYKFQRTILLYGALTGTLPSGLTLLRVVDPEFKTPAASDYVPAAGLMFVFAIPYVLAADLPAVGYKSGNPLYYWLTGGIMAAYLIFVTISFLLIRRHINRDNAINAGTLWEKRKPVKSPKK